jgi:hypothetical protein
MRQTASTAGKASTVTTKSTVEKKSTGRKSTARNAIAAVLALSAATGYLLLSGALDPVLNDAVTKALGRHDTVADAGLKTAPVADWQYFDGRPEWSSVRGVPQVVGPADPVTPSRPKIAPPENPHRWQFSSAAAMPHYKLQPMSSCFQPRGPAAIVHGLTATPGKGSVKIKWWDLGDPDTQSYQIAAVPVDQAGTITWTTVAAPKTCKEVNATITGLNSGWKYEFQLVATNISRAQKGVTYRPSRGQTETVTIL